MNSILDHVIALESYRELLASLKPKELAVVALVLEDEINYMDVSELLGMSRGAVTMRMVYLRRRLLDERPELRAWAAGRSANRNPRASGADRKRRLS